MQHNLYYSFFEDLARRHKEILHDTDGRESYYRSNENADFKFSNSGATPALIAYDYKGRLAVDSAVDDFITGSFEVFGRVDDGTDYQAIEDLKAQCKSIAFQIVATMMQVMDEDAINGPIPGFDPNSVQYSFTGPSSDNLHGCYCYYQFSSEAFNPYTFNPDIYFNP